MPAASYLNIVKARVTDIRSALLFNEEDDPYVRSAGIISALEVDEEGQILFFMNWPRHNTSDAQKFPVRLEFYRKGKPCFIKVNGVAQLIADSEKLQKYKTVYGLPPDTSIRSLVRVEVYQAEYNEPENEGLFSIMLKALHQVAGRFSLRLSFNFFNG